MSVELAQVEAPIQIPDENVSPSEPAGHPKLGSRRAVWRDVAEIVLLVITIYTVVNVGTARALVEGSSMQPNFGDNQVIIVNRFAYYFGKPLRGDVIVLHDPEDVSVDFIKRVIGLPGETVQINKEGRVSINGTLIDEPYIDPARWCKNCDGTWQLKGDEYFVLGDNRANSHDSSRFGPLKQDLIVGKAWIRYWPLNEAQFIPHQSFGPIPTSFTLPTPTITPTFTPRPPRTPRDSASTPGSTPGIEVPNLASQS